MTKLTVDIALGNKDIIKMLTVPAHSTKTPGLVIARNYRGNNADGNPTFNKSWQIVHQSSGYRIMTVLMLNDARKYAELLGSVLDWTQPLEVIQQQYIEHSKELCRIRDESRVSTNW